MVLSNCVGILKCNSICDNYQIRCIWENKSETYTYFQFKQCEKNWRNLEDFYSDLDVHYKWARPLSSIHWAELLGLRIIMAVGCGILRSGNKTWCIAHTDCMLSRLNIDWADSSTKLYTNLRYLWDLVRMMPSSKTRQAFRRF